MRQERVLLGNVKGPIGDPGAITSATADVGTKVGDPTVSVELSGPANDRAIAFHFDGLAGLPATIVSADADTDGTCMEAPELSVDVDELGSGRHNLHFHLNGIRGVPGYFSSVTTEVEDVEIDKPEVVASISGDPGDQAIDFLFRGMRGPSGLDAEIVSADADTDGTCMDEPDITVDVENLGFGRHNLHFHMDGMRGKPGYFTSANAEFEDTELAHPTCDVTVGGEPGAQTLDFLFKGLRGPAGRDAAIQSVTAVVDNTHSDEPTCTVVLTGEPGDYQMEFRFSGIMGLPGPVATAEVAGTVRPDNSTITVDEHGTITAVTATADAIGMVRPDGETVVVDGSGTLSAVTSTVGAVGMVKPDGDSIEVDGDGTISARKLSGVSVGDAETSVYFEDGVPKVVEKVKAAKLADESAKLGHMTVGGTTAPVYLDEGVPKAVKQYESGGAFSTVPTVASDGSMDVGSSVDLHSTDASESDFDVRLRTPAGVTGVDVELPSKSGKLRLEADAGRGCVAETVGGTATMWHRFASVSLAKRGGASVTLVVSPLTGDRSFAGVLVASVAGRSGALTSKDLSWEVADRGVPFADFLLVPDAEGASLYCPCAVGEGWSFTVVNETSDTSRVGGTWDLHDSADAGVARPSDAGAVAGRCPTVLNNSVSTTRLRDLDLDGRDLNDLVGCTWWGRMGWAGPESGCSNLPENVDELGLLVFRAGEGATGQLALDGTTKCSYVRRFDGEEWTDWTSLGGSETRSRNVMDPLDGVSAFATFEYGGNGWQTVNFPITFMFPPIVVATPVNAEGYFSIQNVTTTGFQYRMTKASASVTVTPTKGTFYTGSGTGTSPSHTAQSLVTNVTGTTSNTTVQAPAHTVNYMAFDPKGR